MPYSAKNRTIEEARRLKNESERRRLDRIKAAKPTPSAELLDQLAFEKTQKLAAQRERKREADRAYKTANKQAVLKRAKEYRAENEAEVKRRVREWQAANPDYNRAYYENNAARERARSIAWAASNKDMTRIFRQNRMARIKANGGKLSKGLAKKLLKLQRNTCIICRKRLTKTGYHLDHITSIAKGGANEDWNIQILCPRCNQSKRDHDPVTYMQRKGFLI